MKLTCTTCGKEEDAYKMKSVEGRYGLPRWFCPKCYKKELQLMQELWDLHLVGFRNMEDDD